MIHGEENKKLTARPGYSLTMSIDDMEEIDAQCYELNVERKKIKFRYKVLKIEGLTIFATVEQLEQIRDTVDAELERSKVIVVGGVTNE